jgi:trans-aconitate 2-methyltransferase
MALSWDPEQYLRYSGQRERPFWELVARVQGDPPARIVDLGCGPGNATAALLGRWPQASILGIDSSAAMIEQAAALAQPSELAFELQDVREWNAPAASVDLVLSNATLHWVPGHLQLFARWMEALTPQGTLAFQVPRNFDQPSHQLLAEIAGSPRWSAQLAGVRETLELPSTSDYYERLSGLGAGVDMWEATYHQVLSGPDPVLEWVRGTALGPYLAALDEEEAAVFTDTYAAALRKAYPALASGETLFPFRRLFVVARKLG